MAILASQFSQTDKSMSKCSTAEMEAIQKGTEILHQQLGQALALIKDNVHENRKLAK